MAEASSTSLPPSDPPQRTRVHLHDGGHVITLSFPQHRVDGVGIRELYETTAELSERRNPRILVDLTGVSMASSGLLGILVAMKKMLLHSGGQLHIAVPDPRVMEQFHVSKLQLVLSLYVSVEDATRTFR